MTKPTQRTIKALKEMGFVYQVVERWNSFAGKRVDLFGCIDILAMREGIGLLGIQTTSGANHAARRTKALAEPRLLTWLQCGGRFEIWSFAKRRSKDILKNSKRTRRKDWEMRREELKADDFAGGHGCLIAGDEAGKARAA